MKKVFTLALSISMMFTAAACSTSTKTSAPAASSEPSKAARLAPSTAPRKIQLSFALHGGRASPSRLHVESDRAL